MHQVEPEDIEQMVAQALDELPEELRSRLNNLAIGVEDQARPEDYRRTRTITGTLLGVYRGIPVTRRSSNYAMVLPDRIVIFRMPLKRIARDEAHLYELVRHTVFHEIAHHFGISDARLRELGAY